MECIIDTNVLVYATIEDSMFHEECISKIQRMTKIIIPSTVMEEFVLVLRNLGVSNNFIIDQVNEIVSDERVEIVGVERKDIKSVIEILKKEKLSVKKFNDKLILSVAKRLKKPVFTFDKELKKECKRTGIDVL